MCNSPYLLRMRLLRGDGVYRGTTRFTGTRLITFSGRGSSKAHKRAPLGQQNDFETCAGVLVWRVGPSCGEGVVRASAVSRK